MSDSVAIMILKDTICDRERVKAGVVVEASPKDAKFLINTKRAVLSETKKKVPAKKKARVNKMVTSEDLETRDISE